MLAVKTLEEHCEYIERMSRLSFYFARKWLHAKLPGKKPGELLRDHTPLLYHGLNYSPDCWKLDSGCQRILAEADRLADLEPEEFEETMWKFIAPDVRQRAELHYPNAVGVKAPSSWNCGSLKYDPPKANLPKEWVVFHIANAVGPHSIFDHRDYLPLCFGLLMKESEIRFDSNVLYTSSWLNDREDWLAYFPKEWHDNLSPRQENIVPEWHFGWWGQLVTARGMINPKAEEFVRTQGFLKYACRTSHCSFEKMKKHLKENFAS